MSDLDAMVRSLMRDVGATLRPFGFRGSGRVWRLVTPEGVAVISKQGSHGSTWDAKLFYLNTALVPVVWWEWKHGPRSASRQIDRAGETDGIQALEGRVECTDADHAAGGADRWRVTASTDIQRLRADLLAAVARGAGRLVELLKPDRYLNELLALPDKQHLHWQALVVLLAERGPSPRLDAACAGLLDAYADRPQAAGHIDVLIGWANTRASHRPDASG